MKRQAREANKTVRGFQVVENECIWMKTGVVNFRLCDNAYDCNSCPFDKAMQKAMGHAATDEKGPGKGWSQTLNKHYQTAAKLCRHVMTGRISYPKICTMNYECYHCEFDQWLDEIDLDQAVSAPHCSSAGGYRVADDYYYHFGHTWARFEHGGRVRVGFDDFLVRLFGPAEHVDLPPLGTILSQNDIGWTFGRSNQMAAVLSPISGNVLAVNHKVMAHPEISHEDPYHEGWLAVLSPQMPKRNLRGLYYGNETKRWMASESQKLLGMLGEEYEPLAATGGQPIDDVASAYPELGWANLAETFLGTRKVDHEETQ